MKLLFFSILFTLLCNSCQAQRDFNKELWSENSELIKEGNTRLEMVNDLMQNYLKIGMDKKQVINLLGEPNSDTIGVILPKGKSLPDSLKINYNIKQADSARLKITQKINEWYNKNYQPAKLMSYNLGWTLVDPIFLKIHINEENKVIGFWTKEY
ncbi:hypothetical protein N7U66_18795 [Lacinutrix neustonica]|uniref:Lipoprotein n=1 Tax=Lacinutrix neustonica TaxID=2980107 RepID=A0A9E8MUN3_9FLAO|nr:hypothetical protein [Lacinutrix neustonica]WAC01882.1 hypothetical protein N7U66_18795 [Lacinutrix neustonica]